MLRTTCIIIAATVGLTSLAPGMTIATEEDLARVSGMGVCDNCCAKNVGGFCTYTAPATQPTTAGECRAILEIAPESGESWCSTPNENDPCYVITLGPSKHDGCPTGNSGDKCTIHTDGWCIQYKLGQCQTKHQFLKRVGCNCVNLGAVNQTGQRDWCNAPESTMCP